MHFRFLRVTSRCAYVLRTSTIFEYKKRTARQSFSFLMNLGIKKAPFQAIYSLSSSSSNIIISSILNLSPIGFCSMFTSLP
nr:MAG TPA: hypothetical protein [Caudoviricetes sp.]